MPSDQSGRSTAIGLMDSGLGGLSVMKEVRRRLPSVDLIYFADSAHCPYGGKPTEFIRRRSYAAAAELIRNGAKVVVMACNTASAAALEWLRASVDVPVVGMEPAIKPAASATRNGRVGVLATGVTLEAERFARLLERFGEGIRVFTQPALELVEMVERGETAGAAVEAVVKSKLEPLREKGIDTLVLGCTHYPFLKPVFLHHLGDGVTIIDTGPSVAAQTVRVYAEGGFGTGPSGRAGRNWLLTSGDLHGILRAAARLAESLEMESV